MRCAYATYNPAPLEWITCASTLRNMLIHITGRLPTPINLQRAPREFGQPPERDHPVQHFWQTQNPDQPSNPSVPNEYACAALQGRQSSNQYALPERLFSLH